MHEELYEELRIAVVMNGGVSLAVWIGGVTCEIGRLVAGDSAYGEIQALTRTRTRVDVICGTSAGAVNGAFLAMAMAYHRKDLVDALKPLRSLWINKGSIGNLLRDPFARGSRSLLDGDGYFLESLREAFRALRSASRSRPEDVPIDLVMTTTLLRGLEREYADDFGSRIRDVSHRAMFEFRRGADPDSDAFAAETIADQLALAARSTASFPAAFEPSFIPVGEHTNHPFRPDMKDVASFPVSRFVIDGGVLDNSPIDLALDRIFHQRATGPVRRVLAYVVPDPGTTARKHDHDADEPDKTDELPELLDVGIASLVQIPAVQSISAQLQELREHNERVRARRRARVLLTRHNEPGAIDTLADTLFATYRAQRIADAIENIVLEISKGLVLKGNGLGQRGRREWLRRTIVDLAPAVPWAPTLPPHAPNAGTEQSIEGWRWGIRPVEHLARVLLDVVIRTQRVSILLSQPVSLDIAWQTAYDIIEGVDRLRSQDRDYWRKQADQVQALLGDGTCNVPNQQDASVWLARAITSWQATACQEAARLPHRIAEQLLGLRASMVALSAVEENSLDRFARDELGDLQSLFQYFVRGGNDTPGEVVARLLAFELIQDALGGRGSVAEQELEFVEISARSLSTFGGPEEPARKVAGIQLAHFGAFYKSSWRANDWMWGRVDTVHRLVRILLDPERLRISARRFSSGTRAVTVCNEIRRIGTAASDPVLAAELSQLLPADADLQRELAYLDDDTMIVPESLPVALKVLSRRLEGEILTTEFPRLAEAVAIDCAAGYFSSDTTKAFLKRCQSLTSRKLPSNGSVQPDQLRDLVSMCEIGQERLEREIGTDRLSGVATQAIAVAVSSARTETKLLAVAGKLLAVLRAPTLMFYVFARDAQYRSRTGVAINAAALAAGIVIVSTQVFAKEGPYNTLLMGLGIAAIAAPMMWAALRWPGISRKIGAVAAVVILGLVSLVLFQVVTLPRLTVGTWQSIATASVGLLVMLVTAGFWPQRKRGRTGGLNLLSRIRILRSPP